MKHEYLITNSIKRESIMYSYFINTTFFLLLFIVSSLNYAADTPSKSPAPYNITMEGPTITIDNRPYTVVTAAVEGIKVTVKQASVFISQVSQTFVDVVNKKNAALLGDLIKQLLWEYRYKITGGTVIGSYGIVNIMLMADFYRFSNDMIWAQWKHELTFEDLCAISQKELAKELLLAIGEYHFNKDNPTDLAYPLVTFIKQIDWEIDIIKRYIKTVKIIKSISLMPFFATNDKKLDRAHRALQRILFIKHIFLSWLADYNLASAEKLNA